MYMYVQYTRCDSIHDEGIVDPYKIHSDWYLTGGCGQEGIKDVACPW